MAKVDNSVTVRDNKWQLAGSLNSDCLFLNLYSGLFFRGWGCHRVPTLHLWKPISTIINLY